MNDLETLLKTLISISTPKEIDYDRIVNTVVKVIDERHSLLLDKMVITKNEANIRYGKEVIRPLIKRGILTPYKFDTRTVVDSDGDSFKKAKGTIYFKVTEIEQALEKGNVISIKPRREVV